MNNFLMTQLREGVAPDGTRVVSHEGAYDNFTSIVILLPEKNVGMVILANTEYVGSLLSQAHKILIKAVREND